MQIIYGERIIIITKFIAILFLSANLGFYDEFISIREIIDKLTEDSGILG